MTKLNIAILFFGLIIVATVLPVKTASGAQVVVAPIMERMARAFQGMRTLRASLDQQKTYAQLGISDPVEHGTLFIKRKGDRDFQVRLEIRKPAQRVITVKDNRFTLFQPNIKQAIEGRVNNAMASNSSGAGFFSLFFGGVSQLTRDYRIAAVGDEVINGRRTTHLRLTPHSMSKGLYREIDLWVDNALWMPTQERFVEPNHDVTVVELGEIEVNVSLSDQLFHQKLPGDVQRVRG